MTTLRIASFRLLFQTGDINAFFGLVLDNMTQLIILAALLMGVFQFPKEIVLLKIIPGTAVGVLVGDLIFTWLAWRLAKRTGRMDITAMPLGIDTPSLFAFTFGIIGPAYLVTHDADLAWKIAMAIMVLAGLLKMGFSLAAPTVRAFLPRVGMLGSIAGIAILLIAFFPALKIFASPLVGLVSLIIILVALVGKYKLPFKIPGALAGVLAGMIIFYGLYFLGLSQEAAKVFTQPHPLHFALPFPTLGFMEGLSGALPYLALALPLVFMVIIGGIDVTESAVAVGDEYSSRDILAADGLATLISGLCGGVIQTTAYIGHPAYKHMGAGAGYTLAVALFIGLGGVLGYLSFMVDFIPEAAVAPILIFIGLEIMALAFDATPKQHHKAAALAFIPLIAYLVLIQVNNFLGAVGVKASQLTGEVSHTYQALVVLSNGFILTSLLWASALACIIDRRLIRAALFMGIAAVFSLFGIIHSPEADGKLFLPFGVSFTSHWQFFGGYLLMAVFLMAMAIYSGQTSKTESQRSI